MHEAGRREIQGSASEPIGNNCKAFQDLYREAKARIWPWLVPFSRGNHTHRCRTIREPLDPFQGPLSASQDQILVLSALYVPGSSVVCGLGCRGQKGVASAVSPKVLPTVGPMSYPLPDRTKMPLNTAAWLLATKGRRGCISGDSEGRR